MVSFDLSCWAKLGSVFFRDVKFSQMVIVRRIKKQMSKACIDRSDSLIFQHIKTPSTCYKIQKNIFWVHIRVLWASFPLPWKPNILLVNYDSWWQHQMSVRELRHDRPSGRFSKSRGLSASVSFLPFFPTPFLFYGRHFSSHLWLSFLVLCS